MHVEENMGGEAIEMYFNLKYAAIIMHIICLYAFIKIYNKASIEHRLYYKSLVKYLNKRGYMAQNLEFCLLLAAHFSNVGGLG